MEKGPEAVLLINRIHVKLQLRNIAELLQHSGLLSSGTISATEFFDDSIRFVYVPGEIAPKAVNITLDR